MGVTDHGIGDVTHEGAFHAPEAAAADYDHARVYIFGQVDDRLVPLFVQLQVGDGDGASRLFDLPDLLVEYLLGFAPEILASRLGVLVVNGSWKGSSDRDDVEPRTGAIGKVYSHPGRQIGVRRAVGCQQDVRRKDTQLTLLT